MILDGKKVSGVNERLIVIPRGNNIKDAIVFKARAIHDWAEFHALCPEPKPKVKMLPGGKRELDEKAPSYVEARSKYNANRMAWIVITSLRATGDLEWEKVFPGKPETWANFEEELTESGFSRPEIWKIVDECMEVNALSDAKLDQARADFLSFLHQQADLLSSHEDAPDSTGSGEPANASTSSLPE
jgi:hypothetical protein